MLTTFEQLKSPDSECSANWTAPFPCNPQAIADEPIPVASVVESSNWAAPFSCNPQAIADEPIPVASVVESSNWAAPFPCNPQAITDEPIPVASVGDSSSLPYAVVEAIPLDSYHLPAAPPVFQESLTLMKGDISSSRAMQMNPGYDGRMFRNNSDRTFFGRVNGALHAGYNRVDEQFTAMFRR